MPIPRRPIFRLICSSLLAAMLIAGAARWAPASAALAFTPHRAVYELSLEKSRANGSISRAQGKLEFEWTDICSGWTVSQRTLVQLVSDDGRVTDFGWTLNSLESKDGTYYRFFIRRLNAGATEEIQRGEARLTGPGEGGIAKYSEPTVREITLPKGTLFPTAHSLLLMDAAENRAFPLWRQVFDGSGDDGGLYGISAAFSGAVPPDQAGLLNSPLLKGQKSWRLQLAFFGADERVSLPEHEQIFRIYANGVVDEMLLDYGDFTLRADLKSLEEMPAPQC
jgi:EipB-like